jgi:hypothetical protein
MNTGSIKEYITGFYALNIHHPDDKHEPTGDWHGFIWEPIKELPHKNVTYAGVGHDINSFDVWGTFGIYDDREFFEKKHIRVITDYVFIADYYRAVLDMLYHSLKTYESVLNLHGATEDYFDTEKQKYIVLNSMDKTRGFLSKKANKNLDNWIEHEINYEKYRSERAG